MSAAALSLIMFITVTIVFGFTVFVLPQNAGLGLWEHDAIL